MSKYSAAREAERLRNLSDEELITDAIEQDLMARIHLGVRPMSKKYSAARETLRDELERWAYPRVDRSLTRLWHWIIRHG